MFPGEVVTAVEVGAGLMLKSVSLVMTSLRAAEVLAVKVVVAVYTAVRLCVPRAKVDVVTL
jgi:hypothetical protein